MDISRACKYNIPKIKNRYILKRIYPQKNISMDEKYPRRI
jgi:hypothetical protein